MFPRNTAVVHIRGPILHILPFPARTIFFADRRNEVLSDALSRLTSAEADAEVRAAGNIHADGLCQNMPTAYAATLGENLRWTDAPRCVGV